MDHMVAMNSRRAQGRRRLLLLASVATQMIWIAPAAAQGAGSDGDIIVTARKREERMIDVPVSVAAITGPLLEKNRVANVDNLIGNVPSLYFSSNALSPGKDFINLVIRGIGAQSAGSPAVATIVDGVYVPALSFDIQFMDVERVEVLRGPQGTLFGRNTEGGALNIVLRRPDERTRGRIALTYDEFDTARAQAGMSGQLAEGLFGSASLDFEQSDGYLKNRVIPAALGLSGSIKANDYRKLSGRAALRFKPDDRLDINLAVDASSQTGLDGLPGVPRGGEHYVVRSDFQTDARYRNRGGALTIDYDLGDVGLTSITGYRKVTSRLPFDFNGSPEFVDNVHDLKTSQSITSQEVRLAKTAGGAFKWLLGGYAFDERHVQDRGYRLDTVPIFPSGIFIDAQNQRLKRRGFALFGDATLTLLDRLDLNAGLRYSWEKTRASTLIDFTIPDLLGPGADLHVAGAARGAITDKALTPSASATWRWSRNLTTYVRYARGYRAGGFPLAPADPSTDIPFGPEKSDNFEIGSKASLWNGLVHLDGALYLINIIGQQVSTVVFLNNDPTLPVTSVANAGRGRSKGFEFSADARPVDGLLLGANVGYTDARYRRYVDTVGKNRAGERFPFVPKWTAQANASYRFPISSGVDLELYGAYRHVGKILSGSGVDIDIQFPVRAYDIADIRASLIGPKWKADLFVDNVTNNYVETRVFNAFFFLQPRPFSIVLPPRRAGIRLTYEL
ncbi:TonB-dependent receptor [Rhizorhabdus wittichii DC-6]|nr:TonB-dependent receptor [Rhizorhabdus wittichii DC-6]